MERGRRKYFFFDYDGTLAIPLTREIPQSTTETLVKLRVAGHFIALATGRLQANAIDFIGPQGITNIVADGGYSVTIDGKLVWMRPLDLEPIKRCLHELTRHHILWSVTTENKTIRYSPFENFAEVAGDYYVPTQYDPTLAIDELTSVYKVYIPCKIEEQAAIEATGSLEGVPYVRYNSDTVFVEPMDKQLGIKRMMDELGAPYEDVVVFGDGANDVSMFLPEWTCIAMGNAVSAVKQRADYVTTSCYNNGIQNACEHFGWI